MATIGGVLLIIVGAIFLLGVASNVFRISAYAATNRLGTWILTAAVASAIGAGLIWLGLGLL